MSLFTMPKSRLHPGDLLLKGKLCLPDDLAGYLTGDNPNRPGLELEIRCPDCGQTCRYPYPDHGDPQTTLKMALVVPVEAPACGCPGGFYVGLDEYECEHEWKLGEFKKLVRRWEHARSKLSPAIQAIQQNNVRLRLDMLGYEI